MRHGGHGGGRGHGGGQAGDPGDARHGDQGVVGRVCWGGGGGLAHALLHVALQHVPPLELAAAELAGVAGRDAALVALVPDQGGLVQVAPAAPAAAVLVGGGVPGTRVSARPRGRGLLLHQVRAGQAGLVHQRREEGALA